MSEKDFSFGTEILGTGTSLNRIATSPEVVPIYMTNTFVHEDLDKLLEYYAVKGFNYNRNRNPNRATLMETVSCLENGELSSCFASGMGAIATAIIAFTKAGDHILSSNTLYGETYEIFTDILGKYGVESTFIDITNEEEVRANMRPNTKVIYTETVTNPLMAVPDISKLAEIAHENEALLIVDNTFMTGALYRPLDDGADLVANSLTKFANGHSDVMCGSVTGKTELVTKVHNMQVLLGSQADPFGSWLTQRGIRTIDLRLKRSAENAMALAQAMEKLPYVEKVLYPGLESHPQHEVAERQFGKYYGGMLSIILPEDREKMNKFMRELKLVHYAGTLGGFRTTIAYPALSSHQSVPREQRYAIGITDGVLRISCGIEVTEDLVKDFLNALNVAYGE